MALKGIVPPGGKPPVGVDYGAHLGYSPNQSTFKPIQGMVSSEKSVGGKIIAGSSSETQTINPGVLTNGMSITVEGGRTLNLGNYESARVGVSITVPCDHETLNDAYEYATEWISQKIDEAVKLAKVG